jgi:hypothetical protein
MPHSLSPSVDIRQKSSQTFSKRVIRLKPKLGVLSVFMIAYTLIYKLSKYTLMSLGRSNSSTVKSKNYFLVLVVVGVALLLFLFLIAGLLLIVWSGGQTTTTTTTKVTTTMGAARIGITTMPTTLQVKEQYVCPNNQVVDDPNKCPEVTTTVPIVTTTTLTTTSPIQFEYSYTTEKYELIYKGRVKLNGVIRNTGTDPVYNIGVDCNLFDGYGVKIGDGSLCFGGSCDLNVYPNDEETINFSISTDNYNHVARVECTPTWKNKV